VTAPFGFTEKSLCRTFAIEILGNIPSVSNNLAGTVGYIRDVDVSLDAGVCAVPSYGAGVL
jgi:hypothetical protein